LDILLMIMLLGELGCLLGDEGDRGGCWAALFYFLSVDIGEDFVDE
jgi:hypothetical protein